ncbi:MAG: segregation/condensation protein A [bacterium]|nr:segregation/condensation protein A [bacterium]
MLDNAPTPAVPDPPAGAPISWELPPELEYFHSSEAYRVDLPDFNGPLDLLLYLIQKDEIDIYDIPIARITEQFLAYLEIIQALSLDTAGDFLVMAATLLRIKARLLLPTPPQDEELEEEDPRAELVRRLLEYKRYKEMAASLQSLERDRSQLHLRQQRYPFLRENAEPPQLRLGMFELLSALSEVFDRVSKELVHNVVREVFTVADKVRLIRRRLAEERTVRFDDLFRDDAIKMEVVVTFIAILELAKRNLVRIVQTEVNGAIWVQPAPGVDFGADGDLWDDRSIDTDSDSDSDSDIAAPGDGATTTAGAETGAAEATA